MSTWAFLFAAGSGWRRGSQTCCRGSGDGIPGYPWPFPGSWCGNRGLDRDTAARGSQTMDTGLLNGGDSVAGLFPFLPLFQSISHRELPEGLFGKEPFKSKSFFCLSCSKRYNTSRCLTSGFRIILSLWCHIHLALYLISYRENSSESPFSTTGANWYGQD